MFMFFFLNYIFLRQLRFGDFVIFVIKSKIITYKSKQRTCEGTVFAHQDKECCRYKFFNVTIKIWKLMTH